MAETRERALMVYAGPRRGAELAFYLEELRALCEAAGAEVAGEVVQSLPQPDAHGYLGAGKLEEAALDLAEFGIDLLVAASALSSRQQRELERQTHVKVVDRTALILDIFAQRALSQEGNLQVELAQLPYLLPRLRRSAGSLSRLGGGIGTRGPGESKLETDRRRLRGRIAELERRIAVVQRQRAVSRQERAEVPRVALVGYTNAGKSTLLRALTSSGGGGEDRLFATLDPLTRRLRLPGHQEALLTDTVGFVQDLPTELVAAFRATLEETVFADLLLHVIDVSHPEWRRQSDAVQATLQEIGALGVPQLQVLNKVDRLPADAAQELPGLVVSARDGTGMDALRAAIGETLGQRRLRRVFVIPLRRGDLLAQVRAHGEVLAEEAGETEIRVEAWLDAAWAGRIAAELHG